MTLKFEGLNCFNNAPTTKFHQPMFNHTEAIVLANKQTNKAILLKTSTLLRYAIHM